VGFKANKAEEGFVAKNQSELGSTIGKKTNRTFK
jgi:hypothetical protein